MNSNRLTSNLDDGICLCFYSLAENSRSVSNAHTSSYDARTQSAATRTEERPTSSVLNNSIEDPNNDQTLEEKFQQVKTDFYESQRKMSQLESSYSNTQQQQLIQTSQQSKRNII